MAFSHLRIISNGIATPSYNFDRRVTTFGGGDKLDVMLLQALFRMAFDEFPNGTGGVKFSKPSGFPGFIAIDGLLGPETRAHITEFQKQLKQTGGNVLLDGVIDPYPKTAATTRNTKTRYLLDFLNVFCNNAAVDGGDREAYRRMIDLDKHSEDTWGPKANPLRSALRVQRKFP